MKTYEERDDGTWSSRDGYRRDAGSSQRPTLTPRPRSVPKEDDSPASTSHSIRQPFSVEG